MKKNKALTAAISVLSLTMVSMCAIGGTFAKYTTNDKTQDTATVAAWGIQLSVTGEDATLKDDDSSDEQVSAKVKAEGLAAPGTSQELATVTLTGTPEVSYEILVKVDLELTNWIINGTETYCPLVFNIDGTSYSYTSGTLDEFETSLESAIAKAIAGDSATLTDGTYKATYNANTAVPSTANDVSIKWTWAYHVDADTDAKDTLLAATGSKVDFVLDVTVNQVD